VGYSCSGGDLNPHAFRHTPLKRTCLPFHHPSDSEERNLYHGRCSSQVFRWVKRKAGTLPCFEVEQGRTLRLPKKRKAGTLRLPKEAQSGGASLTEEGQSGDASLTEEGQSGDASLTEEGQSGDASLTTMGE
jgi:hypothetical protein